MIQAIDGEKVCPLVRVGVVGQYPIKSALDMGAHGVVCPMVSTAEDAQDAVRFVKYPPDGIRGVGPRKASNYGLNTPEYVRTANEWTIVAAQIETTQALENLERILSVKGIDIGFVGPADLSMSLGHFFDRSNPKVTEEMKAVVASCETHHKVPGVLAANPEEAKQALSLGFRFVALGSDFRYLISGAKSFLDSVRTR
jgi:2-keto-3-deoxy-L-rhamnonate aldolase RhmA